MAWKFGMGFFGGYYFGPGIFWVLIIAPIRSSLSVEIRSTPTPGRNAPNNVMARNGLVNLQPRRCYGRQATLLPRIKGTYRDGPKRARYFGFSAILLAQAAQS